RSTPLVECRSVTTTSSPSIRTSACVREMSWFGLATVTRRGRLLFATRDTCGARPISTGRLSETTSPEESTIFAGGRLVGPATASGPGTWPASSLGSSRRSSATSELSTVIPSWSTLPGRTPTGTGSGTGAAVTGGRGVTGSVLTGSTPGGTDAGATRSGDVTGGTGGVNVRGGRSTGAGPDGGTAGTEGAGLAVAAEPACCVTHDGATSSTRTSRARTVPEST